MVHLVQLDCAKMFKKLLILGILGIAIASEEKQIPTQDLNKKNSHGVAAIGINKVSHNVTYIDKDENMLRTPNVNYEQQKKKKPKKTPKRTIQKIIKNNKTKLRKIYVRQMTVKPIVTQKIDYEKMYRQEEKQWEETTTQANQRKKSIKYSPKLAGYHIPFQKRRTMKGKRNKRDLSRELYILKDLDEIEFLSKEDGDDVVKAHVKNFW